MTAEPSTIVGWYSIKVPPSGHGEVTTRIQHGARLLTVRLEMGVLRVLVLAHPEASLVERHFKFIRTGDTIDNRRWAYLGSFQTGISEIHVFTEWTDPSS